jgi:hypothetical protein
VRAEGSESVSAVESEAARRPSPASSSIEAQVQALDAVLH